jgi:hypothetical protein
MLRQGQYLLPVGPRDEIAYVAVQDVAEVAALVLAAPEQHVGKLHELTGSASLDGPTVAATRPSASGESSPRAPDAGGTAVSTAILRPLTIDVDAPLVLTEVERVVTGPVEVVLGAGVCERVATCHEFALRRIQDGRPVYGATTGFGPLVGFDGVARLSALTASAHENPQRLVELWADAIAG